MLYKVSILRQGEVVGRAEQNFDITMDVSIKNDQDEEVWHARSAIFSMTPEIRITRTEEPSVSGVEAIWAAFFIYKILYKKHQEGNHQTGGFQVHRS